MPSSAYKPQVEAISPTLPVDNALENQIRHSRDELVQNIHRVDREITNMDHTIEKLKRKQVSSALTRGLCDVAGSAKNSAHSLLLLLLLHSWNSAVCQLTKNESQARKTVT